MINLRRYSNSAKGVSLIELLLYLSLFTSILILAMDIILRAGEFQLETSSRSHLQQNASYIMNRLTYDIHQADSISLPLNLGESGQTLRLSVGSETHTYTWVGTNLEYQNFDGVSTQIANVNDNKVAVNSVTFQRLGSALGNPTIKIAFEIEDLKGAKGGPVKKTFETVAGTR